MLRPGAVGRSLCLVGLGVLAACADQSTSPSNGSNAAPSLSVAGVNAGAPAGQVWRRESELGAPRVTKGKPVLLLTYHNGPVIKASKTMAILWGPQWSGGSFPADVIPGLDQFYNGWNQSNYAKLNNEYYDGSGNVTAASTYLGHVFDNSTPPSGALTTAQAVAEACSISGQNPDPNALYVIYTPTFPSGTNYCAWHTWGNCSNGKAVQAAYEPNPSGVAGCDPQDTQTGHSQMLASLVNTSAHELAETITDTRGTAWYDRQGYENADKCAWKFSALVNLSNGSHWKIQQNWSNVAKGCLQGS
jgi:hypothetical protein